MNCFQEVIIKNGKNYILVDFKRDSLTAARKSGGKRTIFYIKVEKVHDHESAEAAASVFENLVHGSGAFRQEREARVF